MEGFKQSELRTCQGGECWRRWNPVNKSPEWGTEYESWKFPGVAAKWAAEFLRGKEGRPSWIDFAFDYECDAGYLADHLIDAVKGHTDERGLSVGIAGRDDVNTRYVGAPSSDRRVKVYRKDLQSAAWAANFGPVLRVELTVKGKQAVALWLPWQVGKEEAATVAAAHLLDLLGLRVRPRVGEVPELPRIEGAAIADRVYTFLDQYAPMMAVLESMGLSWSELVHRRASMVNRMGRTRMKKLAGEVQAAGGVDAVGSLVNLMLSKKERNNDLT
ncbi:MAG: hypothetical protein WD768_13230 [Phycisphaeraceae bacterium]